jgi:hypothetical protein
MIYGIEPYVGVGPIRLGMTRVEFAGPLSPTFQNQTFLGQPYRLARAWFEARDPDLETDGAGLTSKRFGIALYAGSAEKEPDEPVEAIAVFEKGYYDQP